MMQASPSTRPRNPHTYPCPDNISFSNPSPNPTKTLARSPAPTNHTRIKHTYISDPNRDLSPCTLTRTLGHVLRHDQVGDARVASWLRATRDALRAHPAAVDDTRWRRAAT
eukprot:70685-Prymnesium_polylepis.2